jgi:tetratricopeptide (TPR) repeat protein
MILILRRNASLRQDISKGKSRRRITTTRKQKKTSIYMNTINKLKTQTLLLLVLLLLGVSAVEAQVIEGGAGNSTLAGGIGKAEKLYKDLAYNDAIPLYESYLKKHDSTRAMCELGDCYRLTSNFERAEYWYSKAVEKGDVAPEYKLHYAKMLQANEKYEEAAKWYAAYKQSAPEDKRAGNQLKASADYGQYLLTEIDIR